MSARESYLNIRENKLLTILFLFLFGLVFLALSYIFRAYLFCFLLAAIIYFPLRAVNSRLLRLVKKRVISASVVIIMLFVVIVVPAVYIMTSLANQTYHLYGFLQDKINAGIIEDINSSEKFNNILTLFKIEKSQLMEKAVDTAKQYTFAFFSNITSIISLQLGLILKFFCMVLMLFFLLKDGASLGPMVYRALPFPDDIEHDIAERLRRVINVLITGNLFIMALQGSMLGLGLHIAGFPAVLLWGALGSILSLIPVIGTSIIWIPAALYLLFTGSYLMALFVGIWSIAWYFLLENLLKPLIFGGTLSFHPVLLFFLLLGSIQTFGIAGVLIGPIILTLFISMWEIYKMLDLYAPKKNPKPTD